MYEGVRTCDALLRQRAAERPDHQVARFENSAMTFAELDWSADRIAHAMTDLGVGRQETVAVQLANGPEFASLWLGLARAGITEVPLNVGLRGDSLRYTLNQAACRVVVVAEQWADRVFAVADDVRSLEHIVVVGDHNHSDSVISFSQLLKGADGAFEVGIKESDPALILFTAGTTGPSKGAVLPHAATFAIAESMIDVNEFEPGERLFTVFPLFHINARYATLLTAMLLEEGVAVVHSSFSASRFWDICRAEQISAFNFMGATLLMLLNQPEDAADADNPVRKAWGAPAPVEIREPFESRFDLLLAEGYGLTETGIVASERPSARKPGSCGKPVEAFTVAIQDELGNELGAGEVGEIVVRPNRPDALFKGYYGMPEASLDAFRNLWFHTGDRGKFDDQGWLYFVDRVKDSIRRRGENVSSWEVEQAINSHPDIEESAVVGVPSELTDEEILAYVKVRPGHRVAPDLLLDFVQERVPYFAVPRYIQFADSLPKNPQQRLQKFILREAGLPAEAWDREAVGYVVER